MIIVLDSNEYITFFNENYKAIDKIFFNDDLSVCINDLIIREVLRNIKRQEKKEFYKFLFDNSINFCGQKLPLYLFQKYKKLGLKKGDIEVAAFCDFINADCMITENRHFLRERKFDEFNILNLKEFLRLVGSIK